MKQILATILGLGLFFNLIYAQGNTCTLVREGEGAVQQPTRILLTGDSLMEGLGPQLQRALDGYANLTLIPIGKKSTGLSRPDFYNWPAALEANMKLHQPHIVVMWVGTNDPQNIYGEKGLGAPLSIEWQKAYHNKIIEIFRIVQKHNAKLIMMSPPVMNKQSLDNDLKIITRIMAWTSKRNGALFLNTRPILADTEGKFLQRTTLQNGKTVAIRTQDQVHITAEGNLLVMDKLLPYLTASLPGNKLKKRYSPARQRISSRTISGSSSTPHSPRAFSKIQH